MSLENDISRVFDILFACMKIRYKDYDDEITMSNMIHSQSDKINLFIDLETIFRMISTVKDLERRIITVSDDDFKELLVSEIINLAGHYKGFFKGNGINDVNVYLYNTDFDSDTFHEFKYNEDYRSYFLIKFNNNPKYALFTERFKNLVVPDLKIMIDFIPGIYYISCKNIESSLLPYIIAKNDISRKNLIISGEYFNSQYWNMPNFIMTYRVRMKEGFMQIDSNRKAFEIMKAKNPLITNGNIYEMIYSQYSMYCSLLSVIGDKTRSIDGILGIGPSRLENLIKAGLSNKIINDTTNSPELMSMIFEKDDQRKDFINNYYCTSIIDKYNELTSSDIDSIKIQIVDRYDKNGFSIVERSKFDKYRIQMENIF